LGGMEKPDLSILKKRLSTFRTSKGMIKNVSDELLVDILRAWESWPGTSKEFYQSLGSSKTQMASLMGKAKRVTREGHYPADPFKEIHVEGVTGQGTYGMEMLWEGGRVLRFSKVEQLLEFLQKAKG
jgi:hypothetical protein